MADIFISYARSDKKKVLELYKNLLSRGFSVWLDDRDLLPGQEWKLEIEKAMRESSIFIACVSNNSVNKSGYVQAELKKALEIAEEMPEGEIYIIPVRLDDCKVPNSLAKWHWMNYFDTGENEKLLKAIQSRVKYHETDSKEERKPLDSPNLQLGNPSYSSTLDALLQQMSGTKEHPMRDHAAVLKRIGHYFMVNIPSHIDQAFVVKFAYYLGYLYNNMIDNRISPSLTDSVLRIIGVINVQCRKIETGMIDKEYFMVFKPLARQVLEIGYQLERLEDM